MPTKSPKTPFSTRLSGSAKETELRLRSIFQWQKKRPPVWMFALVVLVIFGCIGLVSCQQEQPENPAEGQEQSEIPVEKNVLGDKYRDFFANYQSDLGSYQYTGDTRFAFDDRKLTLQDVPENQVEELLVSNYCFEAAFEFQGLLGLQGSENLQSSVKNEAKNAEKGWYFENVTIHTLDTLSEGDFTPDGSYFAGEAQAQSFIEELRELVQEYGLAQYSVVYADLSWLWSESALAMGPQLGNGRYERLYLVGKTAEDDGWKLYECFWGEYTLERAYPWEQFALQLLQDSLRYEDEVLSFTIPTPMQAGTGVQGTWDIQIAGRAETEDLGGMSLHYLEGETWQPGKTYTINIPAHQWAQIVELRMEARVEEESRTIDVQSFIRKTALNENLNRLGTGAELVIDYFQSEQSYGRVYFAGQEPGEPQEDDLRIDAVRYLGSEQTYETMGEAYALTLNWYVNGGWNANELYMVMGRSMDGELDEVRGVRQYVGHSVSYMILEETNGVTDWEVSLWHDDNPYPWPLAVGRWNENALSFVDGEPSVEVLEGWDPIYWEGDYWNRCTLDGLSILRYYNSREDRHGNFTIELTRDDFATLRGIRLGSTRDEVKSAYPELKSGDYWGKYPGGDYLWYCDDANDFGPAILFFFKNDTVSKIILNDMFN